MAGKLLKMYEALAPLGWLAGLMLLLQHMELILGHTEPCPSQDFGKSNTSSIKIILVNLKLLKLTKCFSQVMICVGTAP